MIRMDVGTSDFYFKEKKTIFFPLTKIVIYMTLMRLVWEIWQIWIIQLRNGMCFGIVS